MIIVRLKGGMGNQMFQYAFGRKLAVDLDTELCLDLSSLLDRSKGDFVYRDYDLVIFNVKEKFLTPPSLLRVAYKAKLPIITRTIRKQLGRNRQHVKERHFHYDAPLVASAQKNTIYEGWFQGPAYFKGIEETIRKEFTFKQPVIEHSQALLARIAESNAVCLNVRRTDFLKVDTLNTTNRDYFLAAANKFIKKIENPKFFIFSDDIEWCRENIMLDAPVEVVDHSHKGERFGNYMQLMIACKHFIIPNSSFAWWAVWLNQNPDKQVIAPKNWFNDPSINTEDLVPKTWQRM